RARGPSRGHGDRRVLPRGAALRICNAGPARRRLRGAQLRRLLARVVARSVAPERLVRKIGIALQCEEQNLRAQVLLARTSAGARYAGAGAQIAIAQRFPEARPRAAAADPIHRKRLGRLDDFDDRAAEMASKLVPC